MTEADLKAMKLHETFKIDQFRYIMRVPNGWVYEMPNGNVFVPEVLPILQYAVPMP